MTRRRLSRMDKPLFAEREMPGTDQRSPGIPGGASGRIAVRRGDDPGPGLTEVATRQNAYMAVYHVAADVGHVELCNGNEFIVGATAAGAFRFYDLRERWTFELPRTFHTLNIVFPREVLDRPSANEAARSSAMAWAPGTSYDDGRLRLLATAILSAFADGERDPHGCFVEHIYRAMALHIRREYGSARPAAFLGGLSPRQERTAKGIMMRHLGSNLNLGRVAEACGVSTSHFARAFRQTTGSPPHRWLLQQRVAEAKKLLLGSSLELPDIARSCGFCTQSHFTHVFTRLAGRPPGAWKRLAATG